MKRLAKIAAIAVTGVILLLTAALLFTQTAIFRGWARDFALKRVNNILDGELSVGRLDGDLFSHVELYDVALVQDADTVAQMNRLAIDYSLLPLLRKKIEINSIAIDSLSAFVYQLPDSSWNLAHLVREDSLELPDTTRADTTGRAIEIELEKFVLDNGYITIRALDTAGVIPRRIDSFHLTLSGGMTEEGNRLEIEEMRFAASEPDLRLNRLSLSALFEGGRVEIDTLVVETAANRISGSGSYATAAKRGAARIVTGPLDLREFAFALPDIRLNVQPAITLDALLEADSFRAEVSFVEGASRAAFDLAAYPFSDLMDSTKIGRVRYDLRGSLEGIDVARWTGDTTFAYALNGSFALRGFGLTTRTIEASFDADLDDSRILGRRLGTGRMNLDYERGMVRGTMVLAGAFGEVTFDTIAVDLFETQRYDVSFSTLGLDLAQLLNDTTLTSDLNLTVHAAGTGFEMPKARGELAVVIGSSIIYNVALDTCQVTGAFEAGRYALDTVFVSSPYGRLDAGGDFGSAGDEGLHFRLDFADLARFKEFAGTDTLGGAALITGTVTGRPDSLAVAGEISLSHPLYKTMALDTGYVGFGVLRDGTGLSASAAVQLDRFASGNNLIDSVFGEAYYADSTISAVAGIIRGEDLSANIEADVTLGQAITTTIRYLGVDLAEQHWRGGSNRTTFRMSEGVFDIANFELVENPGASGPRPRIALEGRFGFRGEEDMTLDISSLDIAGPVALVVPGYEAGGLLDARFSLTGSAAVPRIAGDVSLKGGRIKQLSFDSLVTEFDYGDQRLTWSSIVSNVLGGRITAGGYFPMRLSFDASDKDTVETVIGDRPLEIRVDIDSIPFAALGVTNAEMEDLKGWIDGEVHFANTFNRPDMSGAVFIHDGGFKIKRLGLDYNDLEMALAFDNNVISLDSLRVRRGDGFMRVTGVMEFDSSLVSGSLRRSEFDLHSDRLFLVRHEDLEIQVSGDVDVEGSSREPRFGGKITIDRSRIFIPLLSNQAVAGVEEFEGPPLLVAAARPESLAADTSAAPADTAAQARLEESIDYFANLRGSATVDIPRNTWLRSPDMNIEISGEIELVKNSRELFEIFGLIDIVRGEYTLYGREFRIVEGQLVFTGGEDYNPEIDMRAEYTFRSPERERRILALHVTGKAFEPQLAFDLDGQEVTESDAVAYIVFGRSMQDVTGSGFSLAGGKDGDGNAAPGAELAKGLAARLLAGQLSKTLGKELALDVIEVNAGESLQGATFSMGKYITSNLFMSYQRGLGNVSENDELSTAMVTLEYEIARFLSLQLSEGDPEQSGLDLLFKFDIR